MALRIKNKKDDVSYVSEKNIKIYTLTEDKKVVLTHKFIYKDVDELYSRLDKLFTASGWFMCLEDIEFYRIKDAR